MVSLRTGDLDEAQTSNSLRKRRRLARRDQLEGRVCSMRSVGFCPGRSNAGSMEHGKGDRNRLSTLESAADLLGDRWSLLIVRNMLVSKACCFVELIKNRRNRDKHSCEPRARLVAHGILSVERNSSDWRKLVYSLTARGSDLLPILTEMVRWTTKYRYNF